MKGGFNRIGTGLATKIVSFFERRGKWGSDIVGPKSELTDAELRRYVRDIVLADIIVLLFPQIKEKRLTSEL